MTPRALKTFIWICLAELIVLLGVVLAPYLSSPSRLRGLPTTALGISAVVLGLAAGAGFIAGYATLRPAWWQALVERADRWLSAEGRLGSLSISLIFPALFIAAWLVVYTASAVHTYAWYSQRFVYPLIQVEQTLTRVDQAIPLLVWGVVFLVQALVLLWVSYPQSFRDRSKFRLARVAPPILVNLITYLTLSQWIVLLSGLQISRITPVWYWEAHIRPVSARDALFLILMVLIMVLVSYLYRMPEHIGRILTAMIVLGCLLQVGFGFIQGGGLEFIRQKYASSKHQSYARIASEGNLNVLEVISQYEQTYGQKMFPGTKPPGLLVTYIALQKLVQIFDPQTGGEARFLALTRFLAFVLPLLTFLLLPLLFIFGHRSLSPPGAYLPGVLYITLPGVLLIPLFMDSALYPLLFLAGVYLCWQMTRRRSAWLALLAGAYIFFASFISFSLLPLVAIAAAMLVFDFLSRPRDRENFYTAARLAVALAAGLIVAFILFRLALNYDFFTRFQGTSFNRYFDFVERMGKKLEPGMTAADVSPSIPEILHATLTNNLEMAFSAGVPVYLLTLVGAFLIGRDWLKRRSRSMDIPLAAMGVTYVALNLYGQTQGEVARIWIFWLVMFVLFAGRALNDLFPASKRTSLYIVFLQLASVWMLFHFQDLVV